MHYENNWESLNARPVPEWFADAKFGIFIHWGIYSVPAYTKKGDYAEWYMRQIENPDSEARKFHDRVYGKDFRYEDFAGMFKAELFDAAQWADIIRRSGAKYMNLVSKHHDGFCLYKSDYAWNWNTVDVGPHRDFCMELKTALEGTGVRFGVYHSVYEWFHPLYLKDPEAYALQHLHPMLKELVTKYEPATLFTDGEWDHESSVWHSTEFLQWLYNESPVKDYVVPNDRWGKETRGRLGGNFTTEYGTIDGGRKIEDVELDRPFEECRGIGRSFGLNRAEMTEDYLSAKELLTTLVDLVAKGGNFLLNIGPAADGTIPVIMEERLLQMGKWLSVNGDAIYGTRIYTKKPQEHIWYTKKADTVYAIIDRFPFGGVTFGEIPYADGLKARLLSHPAPLTVENDGGKARIVFPPIDPEEVTCEHLYAIEFTAGRPSVTVPPETAQEEAPQEEVPQEEPAPEEKTTLKDIACGFGTPVACVFRDNRSDYELPVRTRGDVLIREADANRYPDRESLVRNVHETIIAAFPGALAGLSDTVYFWEVQKQTEPLKEAFETALREEGILAEITVKEIGLNEKDANFIRENKKFFIERAQEQQQKPDAAAPQPVESFVPGGMPDFILQPYPVNGMMDGPGMMYDPKRTPPSYLVCEEEAPIPQNTPDAETGALKNIVCKFDTPRIFFLRDKYYGLEIPVKPNGSVFVQEADASLYPDRETLENTVRQTIVDAFPQALTKAEETIAIQRIPHATEFFSVAMEEALRNKGILAKAFVENLGIDPQAAEALAEAYRSAPQTGPTDADGTETASLTAPQPEAAIGAQPLRCPQCGAEVQNPNEKYCRNCGAPLR